MPNPTRYPAGVGTYKTNHVLNTFPNLPGSNATGAVTQEMSPYTAQQFTVTSTTSTIGTGIWAGSCAKSSTCPRSAWKGCAPASSPS